MDEYLGVFEPLILEEAREGLKADWAEACAAGKVWEVGKDSLQQLGVPAGAFLLLIFQHGSGICVGLHLPLSTVPVLMATNVTCMAGGVATCCGQLMAMPMPWLPFLKPGWLARCRWRLCI